MNQSMVVLNQLYLDGEGKDWIIPDSDVSTG